jgi:integrase
LRELERAASAAKIGHLGTHAFRHTYRSWLDAAGAGVAVQQKMMRHTDIRTTMNIYGDVVTDETTTAEPEPNAGSGSDLVKLEEEVLQMLDKYGS